MADAQQRAQALIDDIVAKDQERGLQVAAYLNGELVVDAWAGLADPATGRTIDGDTLFTCFSCTKAIAATAVHLLADRGKLDYDDRIGRYWPEFAQKGKETATIRQALTHRTGVPVMPPGATPELMCNWDAMCQGLAEMEPLWPMGARVAYHGYTYGWIVGEVVRRVDGRPLARFVQEEINRPLGIDAIFLGIPDSAEPRVATLEDEAAEGPAIPPESLINRVFPPAIPLRAPTWNRADVRRASIPGAGGIMNARSMARHYAGLIGNGVDGARLFSPERLKIATTLQTDEDDAISGAHSRRALAYGLGGPDTPQGRRLTSFGHGGAGGSTGFADPEYGFAMSMTKNRLIRTDPPGNTTANKVAREIRAALGIPDGE